MNDFTAKDRHRWNTEGKAMFWSFQPFPATHADDGEPTYWRQAGWLAAWAEGVGLVQRRSEEADQWDRQRREKLSDGREGNGV